MLFNDSKCLKIVVSKYNKTSDFSGDRIIVINSIDSKLYFVSWGI